MKYKKIRDVIYSSDCDSICDYATRSGSYVSDNRPFWYVLENRRLDLRIWVTSDFGSLQISTARLSANAKSQEYSESNRRYDCKTQTEMAQALKTLFETGAFPPVCAGAPIFLQNI